MQNKCSGTSKLMAAANHGVHSNNGGFLMIFSCSRASECLKFYKIKLIAPSPSSKKGEKCSSTATTTTTLRSRVHQTPINIRYYNATKP